MRDVLSTGETNTRGAEDRITKGIKLTIVDGGRTPKLPARRHLGEVWLEAPDLPFSAAV